MNSLSAGSLNLGHRHRHRLFLLLRNSPLSTAAASPSHFQRRSEDESRAVPVSVWWDFENCQIPNGANVFKTAHCITSAVRVSGIKGPVQITAFGDVFQLARPNQEALSATGVTLTHVPTGGKNSADRSLLVDLMYWVSQNPPPAHLFLISGDRDFAGILHRLRMSNYNILLACSDTAPSVLCSAASITWKWNALVKGESFTGKHFNQPPDGPYNSWYGHYKGNLEDPFAVVELLPRSQSDSVSGTKVVPGVRLRPVPRDILRKIRKIVATFPKGIPISVLGGHVSGIDKNFYGHKNFSQFLLSKPNIVKLKPGVDGQYLVLPASCQRASVPVECSTDGETEDSNAAMKQKVEYSSQEAEKAKSFSDGENHCSATSTNSKAAANSVTTKVDDKPSMSSSDNIDEKEMNSGTVFDSKGRNVQGKVGYKSSSEELPSRKASGAHVAELQIAPAENQDAEAGCFRKSLSEELPNRKVSGAHVVGNHFAPAENQDTEAESGYFRKLWTKWFMKKDMSSDVKTDGDPDKIQASIPRPSSFVESHGALDSRQSADDKVTSDTKDDATNVGHGDKANQVPSFFRKILGWFKLQRNDPDASTANEATEQSSQLETSKRDELFLMDSFWSDLQSFLNTYKGSKVVWNSKTREEIAQNLRKEGPLVVQPLEESDLLHLIDLLISEKKWIEEHPLSSCPFRVVQPNIRNAEAPQSNNNSGRLRSIILASPSQSDKLPEQEEKDRIMFGPTTRPCWKAKEEVLADCRELLGDLFKDHSEGVNIGHFKAIFVRRYGYTLDYKKLGHPKLASLLQTMPGVRVGLSFVYPKSTMLEDDELTSADLSKAKNEENESPWEELGPVDSSAPSRKKVNPVSLKVNYESPVSDDDDMSDSEGEALSSSKEEDHSKKRLNKDECSLLQLLDSWHSEEENKKPCSLKTIDSCRSETALSKQRHGKSYSFVVDPDEGNKDRLIDGILASTKKSGEPRIPY